MTYAQSVGKQDEKAEPASLYLHICWQTLLIFIPGAPENAETFCSRTAVVLWQDLCGLGLQPEHCFIWSLPHDR